MVDIISRRRFMKRFAGYLGTTLAMGALRPSFVMAQGSPIQRGRVKNIVEIFGYGGYDARFLFPYISGPVDAQIRAGRPQLSIAPGSILQPNGLFQSGRMNPLGFHPSFDELLAKINDTGAGASLIDQFGITRNSSTSHDVAQKQFRNGSSQSGGQVAQGYIGRMIDATQMPGLAVWSFGLNEPTFMQTRSDVHPMMVTSLNTLSFRDRSFGSFNCAGVQGANCMGGGDFTTDGSDDSAFARQVVREINTQGLEEMPLGDAVRGAVSGLYELAPVAQAMSQVPVDIAQFRPSSNAQNSFQTTLADIARTIYYLNSNDAAADVRASTKVLACGISGWDSHSNQVNSVPNLIRILGGGIKGLVHYLDQWGMLDETIIILYSEFGRTTRQNGSGGTDHALAGTSLIIGGGSLVNRAVFGPDPSLSEAQSKNSFTPQVALTGTLRQIYGAAGLSGSQLDQVFPERLPGEMELPFIL